MTGVLHIAVVMKPLDGNFAQNALKHGVAGLNIDGCRIGTAAISTHSRGANGAFPKRPHEKSAQESGRKKDKREGLDLDTKRAGRWPANVIHDGSEKVMDALPVMHAGGIARKKGNYQKAVTCFGGGGKAETGHRFGDYGSVSRFFFQVKEFKETE